jgi:hypothetical protein
MRSAPLLKLRSCLALLVMFCAVTLACEERVVRRSGVYSQQQFGDMGSSSSNRVLIVPPPEQEEPFDPLGDLWDFITSPFSDDSSPKQQTVDFQGRGVSVPRGSTGEVPIRGKDGNMYKLKFDKGEYKPSTPAARPPSDTPAPAPAPSGDAPSN